MMAKLQAGLWASPQQCPASACGAQRTGPLAILSDRETTRHSFWCTFLSKEGSLAVCRCGVCRHTQLWEPVMDRCPLSFEAECPHFALAVTL